MKVETQRLKEVVAAASKFIPSRTPMPMLSRILLRAKDGVLMVAAGDMGSVAHLYIEDVPGELNVAVPGKLFASDVAFIDDDEPEVEIEAVDGGVIVSTTRHKAEFRALSGDEYPTHQRLEGGTEVDANFLRAVGMVSVCAKDSKYEVLGGVNLTSESGVLLAQAADGYRAGRYNCGVELEGLNVNVPASVLKNVARVTKNPEYIRIVADEHTFQVETPDGYFSSRLIAGNYPNVERIFRQAKQADMVVIKCNGNILETALKRATVFQPDNKLVTLDVYEDHMDIRADNFDQAKSKTTIAGTSTREIEISLNSSFLLGVLKFSADDTLVIKTAGEVSPIIVGVEGVDTYEYILMPMNKG